MRLILEVPIRVALANPVRALANDTCVDESAGQHGFQVRECFAGCAARGFLANRSRPQPSESAVVYRGADRPRLMSGSYRVRAVDFDRVDVLTHPRPPEAGCVR